jgi:hypothetical protein
MCNSLYEKIRKILEKPIHVNFSTMTFSQISSGDLEVAPKTLQALGDMIQTKLSIPQEKM